MDHARFTLFSLGLALGLFLAMIFFIELGRRLGVRRSEKVGSAARAGVGIVDSAVYATLALLLGFTFSGAAQRFEHRRGLVVDQVVAAGDVWQYTGMLPHRAGAEIQNGLRRYLDLLVAIYAEAPGTEEELQERAEATHVEDYLWANAVAATKDDSGEKARMLLMPALDALFDAVNEDRLAQRIHPPLLIWIMLGIAALAAATFAGYGIASGSTRNWFHVVGVAATIAVTAFVIFELESPRLGLIRMDRMDQMLVELRATME